MSAWASQCLPLPNDSRSIHRSFLLSSSISHCSPFLSEMRYFINRLILYTYCCNCSVLLDGPLMFAGEDDVPVVHVVMTRVHRFGRKDRNFGTFSRFRYSPGSKFRSGKWVISVSNSKKYESQTLVKKRNSEQ